MYNPFTGTYIDTITHHFFSPKSICISLDNIFVSNMDTIDVFSLTDYGHLYRIESEELSYINNICIYDNNLYIADENKNYIIVMDTTGNNCKKISYENDSNSPHCVYAINNKLFVGDLYHTCIQVFDLTNDTHLYNIENLGFVYSIYVDVKTNQLYFTNHEQLHVYIL